VLVQIHQIHNFSVFLERVEIIWIYKSKLIS